jgi:hypothetical protein
VSYYHFASTCISTDRAIPFETCTQEHRKLGCEVIERLRIGNATACVSDDLQTAPAEMVVAAEAPTEAFNFQVHCENAGCQWMDGECLLTIKSILYSAICLTLH